MVYGDKEFEKKVAALLDQIDAINIFENPEDFIILQKLADELKEYL